MPKSRVEFWTDKFEKNVVRDRRNYEKLLGENWRIAVVWECGTRNGESDILLASLADWIMSSDSWFESKLVS